MTAAHAIHAGLSSAQTWLLIVGLIVLAVAVTALAIGKDQRDYSIEVPEPASNVTVHAQLPVLDLTGCDCDQCQTAAGVAITRLLPETEPAR